MNEWQRAQKMVPYYKETYPPKTRIYLENMDDPHAPVPSGTRGTVVAVDDMGQIHMVWDNGRALALVPQVDSFRKLTEQELAEEQNKRPLSERIQEAEVKAVKSNDLTASKENFLNR